MSCVLSQILKMDLHPGSECDPTDPLWINRILSPINVAHTDLMGTARGLAKAMRARPSDPFLPCGTDGPQWVAGAVPVRSEAFPIIHHQGIA